MNFVGHGWTKESGWSSVFDTQGERLYIGEDGCSVARSGGVPKEPSAFTEEAAYWETAGLPSPAKPIAVSSVGLANGNFVCELLASQGVKVLDDAELRLILTDDYLHPEVLSAIGRQPVSLLARPIGRRIWVGPLFVEGRPEPCYRCMSRWLALNRFPQNAYAEATNRLAPQPAFASIPSVLALASGWLATVATILAKGGQLREAIANGIAHFDTLTGRFEPLLSKLGKIHRG